MPRKKEKIKAPRHYGCHKEIPRKDKRQKIWSQQRKERGFDDTETWSLDWTIFKFVLPRLKRFKEVTCGYPPDLNNMKEWRKELNEMIYAIDIYVKESTNYDGRPEKERKKIEKGLNLFFERFYNLWW